MSPAAPAAVNQVSIRTAVGGGATRIYRPGNSFSFNAISREQLSKMQQKLKSGMPEVGHYNPRYSLVDDKPIAADFSKVAEAARKETHQSRGTSLNRDSST